MGDMECNELSSINPVDVRGGMDHTVTEQQEIEVERPLAPVDRADPARSILDALEAEEQIGWIQGGLDGSGCVEEGPLSARTAHRRGFVIRADCAEGTPWQCPH